MQADTTARSCRSNTWLVKLTAASYFRPTAPPLRNHRVDAHRILVNVTFTWNLDLAPCACWAACTELDLPRNITPFLRSQAFLLWHVLPRKNCQIGGTGLDPVSTGLVGGDSLTCLGRSVAGDRRSKENGPPSEIFLAASGLQSFDENLHASKLKDRNYDDSACRCLLQLRTGLETKKSAEQR